LYHPVQDEKRLRWTDLPSNSCWFPHPKMYSTSMIWGASSSSVDIAVRNVAMLSSFNTFLSQYSAFWRCFAFFCLCTSLTTSSQLQVLILHLRYSRRQVNHSTRSCLHAQKIG